MADLTPEERIKDRARFCGHGTVDVGLVDLCNDCVAALIGEVIAEERAACAKVAEGTRFYITPVGSENAEDIRKCSDGRYTTPVIAAAIRARGTDA